MKAVSVRKTRRTLFSFTIVLLFFLVVADTFVITQQANMIRQEIIYHTKHEFDLFSKLVKGSLTKGDYVSVQEAVSQWGMEQGNMVDLSISTANGFVIANYNRDRPAEMSERIVTTFPYGHNNTATITMVKDLSEIHSNLSDLKYQLIVYSVVLVAILGIVLQRVAVRPLQIEIKEHELTESKLYAQTKELQESNEELESYSYSIAHDLRAPLRSIVSFCQILQDEAFQKLSVEEKQYLGRVIGGSKRMAELIDDILDLGRVTRSNLQIDRVNLSELAEVAIERICLSPGVEFNIQKNLMARGDRRLLALLIDNLIGNACKYSGIKKESKVEFGSVSVHVSGSQKLAYFVRDNGVGFNMKYAEKLFKPFQRLHGDSEIEGNGIGLATAQRIVRRHGGIIWAEAEVDNGATFYFTLS